MKVAGEAEAVEKPASPAEPAADLELAQAVADFAIAFDKWSRSLLASDAPSLPRLKLLYALACEGRQRMGDLAESLEVTPRTVTALVDGLEAQGAVRRVPDPTDRRATIIEIVEGQIDVEQRYRDYMAGVARMLDGLGEADRDRLLRICRELTSRFRGPVIDAST